MLDNPRMDHPLVRSGRRLGKDVWESLSSSYLRRAFHGDAIYQQLMVQVVRVIEPARIIETGTYFGDSTRYLATQFPDVPIETCEINDEFLPRARRRLKRFRNVTVFRGTSVSFIRDLLASWDPAHALLFFLDAHWYDYWPLEDEIGLISQSGIRAAFVIDDFEVPSRPEFGFDVEGVDSSAGSGAGRRVCGLDLIRPQLGQTNRYRALLPTYSVRDAFPESPGVLRGHIAVFQNLEEPFTHLRRTVDLASTYYSAVDL